MTPDERAALVKDARDYAGLDEYPGALLIHKLADLIEADGKRLAEGVIRVAMPEDTYAHLASATLTIQQEKLTAEKQLALAEKTISDAPHGQHYIDGRNAPCTCWKADYDAAKEALS